MKRFSIFTQALIYVMVVSACTLAGTDNQIDLEGTSWQLSEINQESIIDGAQTTLNFEGGSAMGNAGCNTYSGAYAINREEISFGPIVQTEMACEEPAGVMEQERIYLEILGSAQRIETADGLLNIISVNDLTLTFHAATLGLPGDDLPLDEQTSVNQSDPTNEPESTSPVIQLEPPQGFKQYQDLKTGISIYIPASWHIQNIVEGDYAIFSSYPPDKYVGGEARQPGDAKCDLNLKPEVNSIDGLFQQWESSSMTSIVSEEDFVLNSGKSALKFVIESMGRSTSVVTDFKGSLVIFTCWGEFDEFDEMAATLNSRE